jgi:predicted metal-dependent hydrolase
MSETTQQQLDEKFFERADAHISLANEHITQKIQPGLVNNSLLYAAARFSAWLAAAGFQNGEEMIAKKKELMDYFVNQYSSMLEENLENYAANYDLYMGITKDRTEKKN